MSILGTLIDRHTVSRAGDDLAGVTVSTYAHSLSATCGELQVAALRSIAELTGAGLAAIDVFVVGSNASLSSVGFAGRQSNASTPTVMADIIQMVAHSVIR